MIILDPVLLTKEPSIIRAALSERLPDIDTALALIRLDLIDLTVDLAQILCVRREVLVLHYTDQNFSDLQRDFDKAAETTAYDFCYIRENSTTMTHEWTTAQEFFAWFERFRDRYEVGDVYLRRHDPVRITRTRERLESEPTEPSRGLRVSEARVRDQPLVSIVTPSFNHGHFIRDTIESVFAQDYKNIEYVVIDGGSSDDTIEILTSYGERLSWVSEPDRSQSDAINKGLRRTHGEIVTWLNSDDILLPGAVSRVIEEFQKDQSAGLVYGATHFVDRDEQLLVNQLPPSPQLWALMSTYDYLCQPSSFFRRSALMAVGLVDETLRFAMDYDLFIRLSAYAPARMIPHQLSITRIYDETITRTGGRARYRELKGILRDHTGYRYPPGVAFYGVEFLQFLADRPLRRFKRLPGNRRIRAWLQQAMEIGSGWVVALSNDVWPDNWVGRVAKFALPRGSGEILRIRGELPGELFGASEQRLDIYVDDRLVDRVTVVGPEFELVYPLSRSSRSESGDEGNGFIAHEHVHQVEVKASRHVIPARIFKQSIDRRRLSWRLNQIGLIAIEDFREPIVTGWFEDHWASPVVSLVLPGADAIFRIRGSVPDSHPRLEGQEIAVSINGGPAKQIVWSSLGEIDEEFGGSRVGELMRIRITASRFFVPLEEEGSGDDRRQLSFLLYEAGFQ